MLCGRYIRINSSGSQWRGQGPDIWVTLIIVCHPQGYILRSFGGSFIKMQSVCLQCDSLCGGEGELDRGRRHRHHHLIRAAMALVIIRPPDRATVAKRTFINQDIFRTPLNLYQNHFHLKKKSRHFSKCYVPFNE